MAKMEKERKAFFSPFFLDWPIKLGPEGENKIEAKGDERIS